ncbi:CPBP family glutamic-type intramembrane protease [Aquimarina gracilis]|uniref:CPBP family glutamic-type intramembrane protease n=1 Tax=Aquimarina gracilis TaxID=874422 RepID=A0ABU6A148_9FLAO|nr:CPBP family glutamic-type intramembrane protease [Aquimarina gracilis]MEB3347812.1 CPBP family glutamic-type intramembrane protease [Aquimarina gracilis]
MMIKNIVSYLISCNYLRFILVLYVFLFVFFILPIEGIEYLFQIDSTQNNSIVHEIESFWVLLLVTIILGPVIETLVFQVFLIRAFIILGEISFGDKTNRNTILIVSIFLAAAIFGVLHFYSVFYTVSAFILGLYFGWIYYLCIQRKAHPFFAIFVIHALYNLTILGIEKWV